MLHDRNNWPTITLPAGLAPMSHAHSFANNLARQQQVGMMGGQQASALMGQMRAAGPGQMAHVRGRSTTLLAGDVTVEEEEDVSRGDMLDFISPRDISKLRYEQHHEWMEEIMSSPYATKQIVPTDLGLGRKGELEALTSGFFEAPLTVMQETSGNTPGRVGKYEASKVEEFTKMAAKKVSDMQADLENMKQKHARRMDKLRKTTVLNSAERRLRTASSVSSPAGIRDMDGEPGSGDSVEDIVRDVEGAWGRNIEPLVPVLCLQRGGLEQRSTSSAAASKPAMNGTESPKKAASLREDAQPTTEEPSAPVNAEEEQEKLASSEQSSETPLPNTSTPTVQNEDALENDAMATAPEEDDLDDRTVPSLDNMDVDMEMDGLDNPEQELGDDGGARSEWVMVDEQGGETDTPAAQEMQQQPSPMLQQPYSTTTPATYVNTPGSGVQSLPASNHETTHEQRSADDADTESKPFDSQGDFDDVDIDTAGDALVDFGDDNEDLGMDVMDDSAFGDAFHPPDDSNSMDNADFS